MARRISRTSLPGADRAPAIPVGIPHPRTESGDVVLRLLHTADWHLGRRFPSFPEEGQKKLSRARMDVVGTILDVARRNAVNAVLCVGDIFDDPDPSPDFWEGLARTFQAHAGPHPPVFLIPGNHDPLTPESVWAPGHPFRAKLPQWVHVVDRDDFTYEISPQAVLYARPCRSKAGENDLAMALPAREPGDERLRIGCVHGCTFDIEGYQTNFPIRRDAGVQRGLDYLAIGDTHSVRCRDMNELRNLLTRPDLDRHVVRLHLDMTVSLSEESEIERILRDLRGTDATHGRVGVLLEDLENLRLQVGSGNAFPENLPPVLKDTVARLDRLFAESIGETEKSKATRALAHLYKLLQSHEAIGGRDV